MKYSLWYLEHESSYRVSAQKHKDTNSTKEVAEWQRSGQNKAASFYRSEDEVNADYIQFFTED